MMETDIYTPVHKIRIVTAASLLTDTMLPSISCGGSCKSQAQKSFIWDITALP
ncbi:MAG: hypothetical protein IPN49_12780 [Saprospiraceae bacterium]|nr:hypothetical protein [Saprospiraceae bacterium]